MSQQDACWSVVSQQDACSGMSRTRDPSGGG